MTLTERQLQGLRRVRGAHGGLVYMTTADFWRAPRAWGPADFYLLPLLIWASWYAAIANVQSLTQHSLFTAAQAARPSTTHTQP